MGEHRPCDPGELVGQGDGCNVAVASCGTANAVERTIRPIALNRWNALFAGSDSGGEHWAIIASLIETAKLNGIDLQAYLADIVARIANNHPINRIDELLPWTWVANR
jgi:hypothetical protein